MDNSGPAFPEHDLEWIVDEEYEKRQRVVSSKGMTLRDYAEIHFIAAILIDTQCSDPEQNVRWGRMHADLWLKAREVAK